MPAAPAPTENATPFGARVTRYRWWIVVLLFFSTTINYVDRQLFANLIPYFEDELRIGPMDLAYINVALLMSYGLGMMFVGRFVDRVGVRVGLAITFLVWNLAAMGHAFVGTVAAFVLIRIFLGLGEAGNFPSAIKSVAEWFPKRERALATGWFNCGSNIGAVITPILVPMIAIHFGWRAAFTILGGSGLIWLFFWLAMYRKPEEHPRVSPAELAHIRSDPEEQPGRVSVLQLLMQRQVYGTSLARFFTEAPWWFYLTWMPKILTDRFGLSDYGRMWSLAIVYLIADFGAVGGGWISSRLLARGYTPNAARKIALLIAACGPLPVILTIFAPSTPAAAWMVVPLFALAASSHQAWSSNVYTVVSDTLPRRAVGTTIGINMAFGAVGSSLFQFMVAKWLVYSGSYALPFILSGVLYLVGLLAMHLLMPRLEPAKLDDTRRPALRWWHVGIGVTTIFAVLITVQIQLNKPKYADVNAYFSLRGTELKTSAHDDGPAAKVGWQDARWTRWRLADGTFKWELLKFDRHGRPFIEPKGATAKKYAGPTAAELEALGH
jgi:MFS transporter, ACS family, hexuronate transporter